MILIPENMGKKKTERSSADILSFLKEETEEEIGNSVQKLEDKILTFIRESGRVSKSSLYKWAKKHGITPAELYRNIKSLQKQNLVKTSFDEDKGELVYEAL